MAAVPISQAARLRRNVMTDVLWPAPAGRKLRRVRLEPSWRAPDSCLREPIRNSPSSLNVRLHSSALARLRAVSPYHTGRKTCLQLKPEATSVCN